MVLFKPRAMSVAGLADRSAVALGYAAALAVGAAVLAQRSPAGRTGLLDWASTNRANLGTHPVAALLVSAVLPESDPVAWIALALVGLGTTGWVLGAWRTLLLVGTAHVLATMVSEGILWYRMGLGLAPAAAAHLRDVGPSYVVVAALAAGIGYGRWPGRILSAIGFALLAPDLFGGLVRWEVAPVGHVSSIVLALGLGAVLVRGRGAATGQDSG